ncbi:MAG: AAA family ATPase [Candidatus Woesearchaeota archaeon]
MGEQVTQTSLSEKRIQYYQERFTKLREELKKIVIGQDEIVTSLLEALIANGHVLVEGIPGVAKTLTIRSLARVTGCEFKRIQFTPDLLPTDIVGITTYEEGRGFYTVKGPVFANFVLADEINRAPPKVQSALLEAMQERQVTIGNQTFPLPVPFFVMATQNPVENLGTYPLPEAQVDRFLYKIIMGYPTLKEEIQIMHTNMTLHKFEDFNLQAVFSQEDILQAQKEVNYIHLSKELEDYIVRIVDATRNPQKYGVEKGRYVAYGASPRSTISMFIASKARALVHGRGYVTPHDLKAVAKNVLRHRLILNYEGQAEQITSDMVIQELLQAVPIH